MPEQPSRALSERQAFCLLVIESSIRTRGYPPSLDEIGAAMDIGSNNAVTAHLRALEQKGFIARETMRSRAITVLRSTVNVDAIVAFAKSDSDWLADIVVVAMRYGFRGSASDLPKWLDAKLDKGARS